MRSANVFFVYAAQFLYRRVGVDPVNNTLDSSPRGQVSKDLYDASPIREGRLLEYRQILHDPVMDDVLHALIDKVDLPAVQVDVV